MATEPSSQNRVINTVLQNPTHDEAHLDEDSSVATHTQEQEVAHAKHYLRENIYFFAGFLSIILLTVITASVNFGPTGNRFFMFFTAALRSGLIAFFMLAHFKPFSLIKSTFIFSAIFLTGMIFLSWWDSELVDANGHGLGNPIWNWHAPPQMMHQQ